jgi:hypothetical protein
MINTPVGDEPLDIPSYRERIRKMSDEELLRCGQAAAYMASPAAAYGPAEDFGVRNLRNCGRSGGDGTRRQAEDNVRHRGPVKV